ncbi:putative defense protein 3 [Artemia franciscana]|uniref:putative defense protein 3 n=1 Tax=Artemia franciscana TaxID=6661 RepID=UPI0032DA966F
MWKNLTVGLICLVVCQGFPNGAPSSVCNSWAPRHFGTVAKAEETFPYTAIASSDTFDVDNGISEVTVTIEAPDDDHKFKGFVVAAFDEEGELFGDWKESNGVKKLSKCKGAVTHSNGKAKSTVTVTWIPPADVKEGFVQFRTTVVKNYKNYWTFIPVEARE